MRPLSALEVQELVDRELSQVRQLIAQLQGAMNGEFSVSGLVNTATGDRAGTGFSVARIGTGDVVLTFDVEFPSQIRIVAMPVETAGALAVKGKDAVPTTTTTARLQVFVPESPFSPSDSIIAFIARG
jgi:hypothetical protein